MSNASASSDQFLHADDGEDVVCEFCETAASLRERAASLLGSPWDDALVALERDELKVGLGLLSPQEKGLVLGDLGLGGGKRKFKDASLDYAAMRIRRLSESRREILASMLSWPVWKELCKRSSELDDDRVVASTAAVKDAVGELIPRFTVGLVRLAIAAHWDEGPGSHRVHANALQALVGDDSLCLAKWASSREELSATCTAVDEELRDLAGDLYDEILEAERAEAGVRRHEIETLDLTDPAAALRLLETARDATLADLSELSARIAEGFSPDLRALDSVFAFRSLREAFAFTLDLDEETEWSEIEEGLMGLAVKDAERASLERAERMEGPAVKRAEIDQVKSLVSGLLDTDEWDDADRSLTAAITALLDLVECDPEDVDTLLALDEKARAGLPAELVGLCALTGRGLRLTDADGSAPDPVPVGAPVQVAEEQVDDAPAPAVDEEETTEDEQADEVAAQVGEEADAELELQEDEDTPALDGSEQSASTGVPTGEQVEAHAPVPAGVITPEAETPAREDPTPPAPCPPAPAVDPVPASVSPPAEDTTGPWDEFDPDPLIGELVGAGRLGLAYWGARSADLPKASCEAIKAAALAGAMRSGSGLVAASLADILPSLRIGALEGDRAGQLLSIGAAIRASLLAPYPTDADDVMQELGESFTQDLPSLVALAQAAREASLAGVTLAPEDLSRGRDLAEMEQGVTAAQAAGREMLERPRTLNFQRASVIWRRWVAEKGIIFGLLEPVAADRRSAHEAVSQLALRLRSQAEIEKEIDSIDRQLRGTSSNRLEGRARRHLITLVVGAIDIASDWSEAVVALEQRRPAAEGPFATLRRVAGEQRPALLQELRALAVSDSVRLTGATRAVATQLESTLDLLDGVPLRGAEVSPELALAADLLVLPDVELNSDLSPQRFSAIAPELCERPLLAPPAALEVRMARRDVLGARRLIDLMKARGDDLGEMATLVAKREGEARQELARLSAEVQVRLDRARRQNYLTEEEWRDLTANLERAADPDHHRLDLDAAEAEIANASQELEAKREVASGQFLERLTERRSQLELVERVADRISNLLSAGDLATAEEYLVLAEAGEDLPGAEQGVDDLKLFFPAVPRALEDVPPNQILEAVQRGERLGPLDFGAIAEQQRMVAQRALAAWFESFRRNGDPRQSQVALRLAGIEAKSIRTKGLPQGGGNRAWFDLVGVQRIGNALVPAFGSGSGDTLRVMVCRSAEPATILGWISQDTSDRPVIVLHRGVVSPEARRELATLSRKEQRTFVVIDDAAIVYLAAQGDRRFDTMMRITLPFAQTNPYQPEMAGNVPVEMFYGRSAERARVIDKAGTSLIYGGRQLGKSALLRSAARRFEQTFSQTAIYIDVAAAEIGTRRDPGLIWALLYKALTNRGIAKPITRRANAAMVRGAIESWLEDDPERRLLLLLDECDTFFDQDAQRSFQNTVQMRTLMEDTNRGCKVVFAGLHQVQRFAGIPNQPLAHLGKPQAIGPLAPSQAFALLHVPLEALGFRINEDLVARALAYTNYSPLNLQLFGRALVRHLTTRPPVGDGPPWQVTEEDIEAIAESSSLQGEIRERFHFTLSLDPRYRVMGYVMAYRTYEDGPGKPLMLGDLRRECDHWWPAGFAGLSADEFRALVEEMRGLGVLAVARTGGYIMRSPAVLRMLGTYDEVIEELVGVEARELPPAGFLGALARRPMAGDPTRRSPLSDQQLAELVVERRHGNYLAIGSAATGIDRVAPTLVQAGAAIAQADWVTVALKRRDFDEALSVGEPNQHRVIVSSLEKVSEASCRQSLEMPLRIPAPVGVTRSCVFVGGPPALWAQLLEQPLDQVELVELRRYDQSALEAWAIDEERAFQDPDSRARLLALTGGWPSLVERVSVRIHKHGDDAEAALGWLEGWLATSVGAAEFIGEVGVSDDSDLIGAYDAIVQSVGEPEEPEQLVNLVSGLHPHPRGAVAVLRALGALTVDDQGNLAAEPVLGGLWAAQSKG